MCQRALGDLISTWTSSINFLALLLPILSPILSIPKFRYFILIVKQLCVLPSSESKCSAECFKILDSAQTTHCIKLKEALHMSRLKPELNTQMHDNFTPLPKKKEKGKKRLTFQVLHLRRRV